MDLLNKRYQTMVWKHGMAIEDFYNECVATFCAKLKHGIDLCLRGQPEVRNSRRAILVEKAETESVYIETIFYKAEKSL